MKQRHLLGLMLTALIAQPAYADDAADVRAANQRWTVAMMAKDLAAVELIVGPEFALTWGTAGAADRVPRDQWIANFKGMTIEEYRVDIVDLEMVGDIAVATIDGNWTVTNARGTRKEPFKMKDVWVRRAGGWQVMRRYVVGE